MPFIVFKTKYTEGLDQPTFVPTGTYSVTTNGTYNISDYEFVDVNIDKVKIKKVYANYRNTWVLMTDGTLYGCGYNDVNQMGLVEPVFVKNFTKIAEDVKELYCGDFKYATWILKNDNTLWGTGVNTYGQQGSGDTTRVTTFTKRASNVAKFIVAENNAGSGSTWYISTDGDLYGCGSNTYGQQGSGSRGTNVLTFTKRLSNVKDATMGTSSMWAVKNDGTLWGCGYNSRGEQGTSTSTSYVTTFTQRLTDASNGVFPYDGNSSGGDECSTYSLGLSWVYGTGSNKYGQLAMSSSTTKVESVTALKGSISEVYNCSGKLVVLSKSGTLYSCGYNNSGSIGSGNTENQFNFITGPSDVKKVVCDRYITYVLKNDGTLWGCGYNGNGQMGNGNTTNLKTFTQLCSNVKDFVTPAKNDSNGGLHCLWIIKNDDTLWGCGDNYYGEQGNGEEGDGKKVTTLIQKMADVESVSCSWSTTWVVKKDGTLWGCGYNDCGQQGNGTQNNVLEFTQRKVK